MLVNFISSLIVKQVEYSPRIPDIINAHKTILENIAEVFELYTDTWHYDHHAEVQLVSMFKILLDYSRILINLPEKVDGLNDQEHKHFFIFEYWENITGWMGDQVQNFVAQKPLKMLMPFLLDALELYNKRILNVAYYWKRKDWPYLKLGQSIKLPTERNHQELLKLNYDRYNFYGNRDNNYYYTID